MPTFDKLITETSKEGRICPLPLIWNEVWELLPEKKRGENGEWCPSPPLILAAWHETSNNEKKERFLSHLDWAKTHDAIELISKRIFDMRPEDWLRNE